MPWVRRDAAALAAGVAWPFAFAPFHLWPLAIAALAALFLLLEGMTPRRAALRAGLFGIGMFGAGVWWVFISMHGFGGLHWSLAAAVTLVQVMALAGFVAGFGWIAVRLAPDHGAVRWLAVIPAAWVAVEWLRTWFLSGFPWLMAGTAFTDATLGAWAPVGGTLTVSLAAALTAGVFVYLLRDRPARTRALLALALGTAVWTGGALLERVDFHQPAGAPLTVALVQGNVTQDLKWDPGQLYPTMRLYHDLYTAHRDADIVVWPEAALPALREQVGDYLGDLGDDAAANDTAVIMGILVRDADNRYYNAVVALGDGDGEYRKRHLVPFGEFFPVPSFVRSWLRMMNLPYSDFTRGETLQAPLTVRGYPVAASVCYEATYGATLARDAAASALLVNVSNDAWFGDTIAPHQHLQIVRTRAREAGRWMLRATNTGITAVVDPRGRVMATLPQFETGVLRAEVVPMSGATPYARFRDWPVLVLLAGLLGLGAWRRFGYP